MKKDQILHKAVDAAMEAIDEDLRQNRCGYAKMVVVRNSMISNLKESLNDILQTAE